MLMSVWENMCASDNDAVKMLALVTSILKKGIKFKQTTHWPHLSLFPHLPRTFQIETSSLLQEERERKQDKIFITLSFLIFSKNTDYIKTEFVRHLCDPALSNRLGALNTCYYAARDLEEM